MPDYLDAARRAPAALPLLLLLCCFVSSPVALRGQAAPAADVFETQIRPFLAKNCYACHNAQLQSGKVNFEQYASAAAVAEDGDVWEMAAQKLRTGQMPPAGFPRPDKASADAVETWIRAEFERAEAATPPNPGRVVAQRLNRAEYNNTVRDLLGVDFEPAAGFPEDDSGYGFDNIGDVLTLSPILMEKYLAAAETAVDLALYGPQNLEPTLIRHQPPQRRRLEVEGGYVEKPVYYTYNDYDLTGLSQPQAVHATHRFPADGEYVLRVFTQRNRPPGSEDATLAVWVDGEMMGTVQFGAQQTEGERRELRVRVTQGTHWLAASFLHQFEGLPPLYGAANPTTKEVPEARRRGGPEPPAEDASTEERAAYQRQLFELGKRDLRQGPDALKASWIEVVGPFEPVTGPSQQSLEKIFTCGHHAGGHTPACARRIIGDFAHRAFRRPVDESEVDGLLGFFVRAQSQGRSFEDSIGLALKAVMVLPDFLFRIEKDP